jgi:sporulation protein YlmC with PRC-barrel domain/DNA-directed RNA polymerase subunit RPC12/RpoP
MSLDLKLKKLRGSGGYIMAVVTDDQQRKGNLGGPDLFLAPIGRIETERISKYYCNTCERDYDGAPKIQFENPNEEVAENLILVEKGQYICTNCSSTLAEYREFKKPSETAEIGVAKPMMPPTQPVQEQYIPPQPTVTIPDFEPQPFSNIPTVQDEFRTFQQPRPSFNTITGMSVYDSNAKKIGTVKQVGVDYSQTVVLIITKNDGSETSVKWNEIKKIGDVIILGEAQSITGSVITTSFRCSNCGFENKPGSKFCENCGTKI